MLFLIVPGEMADRSEGATPEVEQVENSSSLARDKIRIPLG